MKLKEKLAIGAIHDLHASAFEISADILIKLERKAFILGFEKAREMAKNVLKTAGQRHWGEPVDLVIEHKLPKEVDEIGEEEVE